MRGALCTDWEIKLSCRLTRYQKSTDSPMAATSPRTQQLGKPEPSSMAAARRTTTIINESLKSARKRPTTCGTLTPSGRSPSGVRCALRRMASHSCTTVHPGPSSPKVVTTAGVKMGTFRRRPSSTCFRMTYRSGLYVWYFFARAVSIAAAGLSRTAFTSESSRSHVRAASACLCDLPSECTMVPSTSSSSGPCRSCTSRRTAFFSSLK